MKEHKRPYTILMAEDDEDDCLLIKDAFIEIGSTGKIHFVKNGEELLDYLHRRGSYTDRSMSPRPDLILLDLNMPKKDGREALFEIKSDTRIKDIPIVVFTTSREERDIKLSYDAGASGFIVKPPTFEALVDVARSISKYWFEIGLLPHRKEDT